MPLLGYKKQFAPLVESGEKRQTIRAMRKRQIKSGDRLYHYYGLRTKACRKLLESDCASVDPIRIDDKGEVYVAGRVLTDSEKALLAHADGFRRFRGLWEEMFEFFKTVHGLPFEGQLIRW